MRPIYSRARSGPFVELPWTEVADYCREFAADERYMGDIVDSVLACGGDRHLAGVWTLEGLAVAARPLPEPPIAEVFVYWAGYKSPPGTVLIEHRSISGHDDRIVRPVADAVPLFWRFVIEKFGITPER